MKKIIVALFLVLAACQPSDKARNKGKDGDGDPNRKITEPNCRQQSASNIFGTWKMVYEQDGFDYVDYLEIQSSYVRATRQCVYGAGRALEATVQAQAVVRGNMVSILENKTDTKRINDPDLKVGCTSSVSKSNFRVQLRGSCLIVNPGSANDQTMERVN